MNIESKEYQYKKGIYYTDVSYHGHPVKPSMTAFLNGNVEPMIAEINQAKYEDFSMNISSSSSSFKVNDQLVNSLATLISQTPSITSFDLRADVNSVQALALAEQIANSNIDSVSFRSNNFSSEGMADSINTLSNAKLEYLSMDGPMDDATIAAMQFSGTSFDFLTFSNLQASDIGLITLFQNLYWSSVSDLAIFYQDNFSAEVANSIDLSQTMISTLEFFSVDFGEHALANLHLWDSPVKELRIDSSHLTADDLAGLSNSLCGSQVKSLILDFKHLESGELLKLDLRNTEIENLSLHDSFGLGNELQNLHLENTKVKTLKLSVNQITDKDLNSLHLKNTSIEHLDLNSNKISENGRLLLKDIIKDTHVIDVSLNNYEYKNGVFEYHEYTLYNEHPLAPVDSIPSFEIAGEFF